MDIAAHHSVTHWLGQVRAGDAEAAQKLWERYFQQLVKHARDRLPRTARQAADEEDVALSAFASFCRGAAAGRFPRLNDRTNLWTLLITITSRKVADLVQHENRQKRRVAELPARNSSPDTPAGEAALEHVLSTEPTPEFAVQAAEEYQRLLGLLGNESLRSVAVWKMEGYTTEEIAARLHCTPRTVERKCRAIRNLWSQETP